MYKDKVPMKRISLPKAPAFAKTPRLTSGRANEAFVLAMTRSLPSTKSQKTRPVHDDFHSSAWKSDLIQLKSTKGKPIHSRNNRFQSLPARNTTESIKHPFFSKSLPFLVAAN
jgi:hypothetical protein